MSEILPPKERIKILTARIRNLNKGAGDYEIDARIQAITAARKALERAERDLAHVH
jgi:citrate lyase gamma subunit